MTSKHDDHMPTQEEIEAAARKRAAREAEKNPGAFRARIWNSFNRAFRRADNRGRDNEHDKEAGRG